MSRPRDPITDALARFRADGVAPDLALARPLAPGADAAAGFTEALAERGWRPLTACVGYWKVVPTDDAVTHLAACRYRAQAYGVARGDPAAHLAAARELIEALGVAQARLITERYKAVSPRDLSLPKGGWGFACMQGVTDATFEDGAFLVGATHAALLVWTDED